MSENQVYNDEQFCYDVLDSDLDPIEKIKRLNSIPNGCPDIVAEMLKYGPYLENYFEYTHVFYGNENVIDFIGGTVIHFEAMMKCVKELSEDEDYKELYKANKKYIMAVRTAAALVEKYFSLFDIWDNQSGTKEEFYREAISLVELCTDYFENAHIMLNNDRVYYYHGQKSKIHAFIEGEYVPSSEVTSAETAPVEETPVETASTVISEADDKKTPKNDTPPPKASKKIPASMIWLIISGGVCLVLTLLALLTQKSIFNFILAGSGVVELIVAVVLFNRTSKMELLTCTECGGQRKESHRKYIKTTTHEKFFQRNANKTADESIHWLYSYTHHYLSTYTCTKCGASVEKETSDGGGCLTVYYSERRKDTRTDPREF